MTLKPQKGPSLVSTPRKGRLTRITWLLGLAIVPLTFVVDPPPSKAADPSSIMRGVSVRVPGGEQRVTLRLRQLDVADALRLIGQRARLSLNIGSDVHGTVDFDFYNERLNRILEIILTTQNLQMHQVGRTYMISGAPHVGLGGVKVFQLNYATAGTLAAVLGQAMRGAGMSVTDSQLLPEARSNTIIASGTPYFLSEVSKLIARLDRPLEHKLFHLNYIDATEAQELLRTGFLSVSGSGIQLLPVKRDNSLMAVGTPEDLRLAAELLDKLDRRLRQVLIEVKLVELSGTANQTLGVTFDAQSGTLSMVGDPAQGLSAAYNPSSAALSQLHAHINALLSNNKARLLASPTILAMDSKSSKIEITDDVVGATQIQTQTNNSSTQTFRIPGKDKAGITLGILPKINPDGYITMEVTPSISFIRDKVTDSQGDVLLTLLSTRTLTTPEVRVMDGDTLIIGGLNQERVQDNVSKLPILGDIPFLGQVFSTTTKERLLTELVVMITPKIVHEGNVSPTRH